MIGLIVGVLTILVAFTALGCGLEASQSGKRLVWKLRPRQILSILGVGIILTGCFSTVPTGYTGIVTTFGKVENFTLEAGFHLISPIQKVILMDNREQKNSFNFSAFSSDIQQVEVTGSINYNIDKSTAMVLYKEVGTNYFDILIAPRMLENTKAVFSRYSAENLVANRDVLSTQICERMQEDMSSYGIRVISVAIEDLDFTDSFTNAVEEKQVAAQNKLTAETKQEQQIMEAEAAAKRDKIAAETAAEVQRINADAQAYEIRVRAESQAEANKLISESINSTLIEYNYAQSWNGELPDTYIGNGDAIPIINTSSSQTDEDASSSSKSAS